jgi:type III pantothenate kinase
MSVNLCIDQGNTNVKAAIFDNDKIQKSFSFPAEKTLEQAHAIIELFKPEKAIFSSVSAEDHDFTSLLRDKFKSAFVMLDGYTRVPINNAYASPETLGPDRLAMVTGAHVLNPTLNNLVISLGTCITYNFVLKTRTFRGGAISPGLQMRLKAMHEFTERLPLVGIDGDALLLGYDTESCMRGGAVLGMAAEIDGMIKAYEEQYPDFNAILTGGDAPFFADKIKSKIFADPDILLKGLNIILNYNVPIPR